jgi:hypothetical protein
MLSKYTQKFFQVLYTYKTNNSFHNGFASYGKFKVSNPTNIYLYMTIGICHGIDPSMWWRDRWTFANMTAYLDTFLVFHTHVMHILDKILFCEALEVHPWDRHLALYTWTWHGDFICFWNFRFREVFKYSSYRPFSHFFCELLVPILLVTRKNCVDFLNKNSSWRKPTKFLDCHFFRSFASFQIDSSHNFDNH